LEAYHVTTATPSESTQEAVLGKARANVERFDEAQLELIDEYQRQFKRAASRPAISQLWLSSTDQGAVDGSSGAAQAAWFTPSASGWSRSPNDPARDWRPADGMKFQPNALRAFGELAANVVVTAGPGAGKTELLAQRADFLLTTGVCRYLQRVLAISFKLDAPRNIRERVGKRCGERTPCRGVRQLHLPRLRQADYRQLPSPSDGEDALDRATRLTRSTESRRSRSPSTIWCRSRSTSCSRAHAPNAIRQTYTHVFLDEKAGWPVVRVQGCESRRRRSDVPRARGAAV
jgi:hypothetical protein